MFITVVTMALLYQTEFTDDPTLGFVDAGITFVIHSPKIPPRFNGLGLHSPVGMHSHTSIRLYKVFICLTDRQMKFQMFLLIDHFQCKYITHTQFLNRKSKLKGFTRHRGDSSIKCAYLMFSLKDR